MSRWYEPIDRGPGRLPIVRRTEETVTYEFGIVGGAMEDMFFTPPRRLRLRIHCDRSGVITARMLEGRSSGV